MTKSYRWGKFDDTSSIEALSIIIIVLILVGIVCSIGGFFTMIAWNILMPIIFGLSKLTFLQAIAFNVLTGLFVRVIRK